MPQLAGRGQGCKQKSDGDENLSHGNISFFSIDMRPKGASYILSNREMPNNLGG
jgi:hypothetical protein